MDIDGIIDRCLEAKGANPPLQVSEEHFGELCTSAREVFLSQSALLELEAPMTILGDIHGQYQDLLRSFEYGGMPPETNYLFLGNYVDHGKQGMECITLLFAYKAKYPENFFLLRGNHECASLTRIHGFYDECKRRYNIKMWKRIMDVFNCMPVCALIDEKIMCMHGGLSPELNNWDQIRRITRPTDVPDTGLICDLLWADPDKDIAGWAENDQEVSFIFGPDVVSSFLQKFDLDLVIRGKQLVEDGYEFFAKRQLITLWSAPNFLGESDNSGAQMHIDEDLMCSFKVLKPVKKATDVLFAGGEVHEEQQEEQRLTRKQELQEKIADLEKQIRASGEDPTKNEEYIDLTQDLEEEEAEEAEQAKKFEFPTYQLFLLDLFVLGLGLMLFDVGSDILVVFTYFKNGFTFFFIISLSLLFVPMSLCWWFMYTKGRASWVDLPRYVFQVRFLQEVCTAARLGKKTFELRFIVIGEVMWESFYQSTLAVYALLIQVGANGRGFFGVSAQTIFQTSAFISWCAAAKNLSAMDSYNSEQDRQFNVHLLLRVSRSLLRFCEICARVLSLAYFAAIMRPPKLGPHEVGQVAVWVVLLIDFVVCYAICRFMIGSTEQNFVFASMLTYCAPVHFLGPAFQRVLRLYYGLRLVEMFTLVAVVYFMVPRDHIKHCLARSRFFLIAASFSCCTLVVLLVTNEIMRKLVPKEHKHGARSWLILPSPPHSGSFVEHESVLQVGKEQEDTEDETEVETEEDTEEEESDDEEFSILDRVRDVCRCCPMITMPYSRSREPASYSRAREAAS